MSSDLKELRIRNLLMYGDKLVEVSAIFRSHFNCESMDGISYGNSIQSNFKPIPLTEEWLLKFGFELLVRKSSDGYKNTIFSMKNPSWTLMELDKGYGVKFWQGNSLLYVHQLQNLYHCLCGEELTIKL